jgi:hypothetical protein
MSLLLSRLAEEFTRSLREGGTPDIEQYAMRYPQLAVRIRQIFPTLLALEDAAAAREGEVKSDLVTADPETLSPSLSISMADDEFVSGTVVSERYRIVGLLGRGGMGEVYRAEDLKLRQQVALKFLSRDLALDGAALARLHQEVRLARQISHPNVCRVFDVCEDRQRHFLSMEYIDGENLASLLR